jgi:hypothetical protein
MASGESTGTAASASEKNFKSGDSSTTAKFSIDIHHALEGCAKDSPSSSKLVGATSLCRITRYGAVLFKYHIKAVVLDCYRTTELFPNQRDHKKLSGLSMPFEMKTGAKVGSATRYGKSLSSCERETLARESTR